MYSAHRLSYELANGPIPPGMCILHSCDNPPCVRPDHLSVGTKRENNDDCTRKERRRRVGTPLAKLSEEDVRNIRISYEEGQTQRDIAGRYEVTQVTISNVIRRRTYTYVT
jgi:DNA-directed RNA polymerase specialized sigma24 family protein